MADDEKTTTPSPAAGASIVSYLRDELERLDATPRWRAEVRLGRPDNDFDPPLPVPLHCDWSLFPEDPIVVSRSGPWRQLHERLLDAGERARLCYGYPLFVDIQPSDRAATHGDAVPVFLRGISVEWHDRELRLRLEDGPPVLNDAFVERVFDDPRRAHGFVDSLRAAAADDAGVRRRKGLTGLVAHLAEQCGARVVEPLDPEQLAREPSEHGIRTRGLHNRALVVIGTDDPAQLTVRREIEQLLPAAASGDLDHTALAALVLGAGGRDDRSGHERRGPDSDAEVHIAHAMALDPSQEDVVRSAFASPLTVALGPSGTGRSHIAVATLTASLVEGGSAVYVASDPGRVETVRDHTDDAVDAMVVARVAAPRGETRPAVRDQSPSFLRDTAVDRARREHDAAETRLLDAERATEEGRRMRNAAEQLDRQVSRILAEVSPDTAGRLDAAASDSFLSFPDVDELHRIVDSISERGGPRRPVLGLWHPRPERVLRDVAAVFAAHRDVFGSPPPTDPDGFSAPGWHDYLDSVGTTLGQVETIARYHTLQRDVGNATTTVALAGDVEQAMADAAATSQELARVVAAFSSDPPLRAVDMGNAADIAFAPALWDILVLDEGEDDSAPAGLALLARARHALILGDGVETESSSGGREARRESGSEADGEETALIESAPLADPSLRFRVASVVEPVVLYRHHGSHVDLVRFGSRRSAPAVVWTDHSRFHEEVGLHWTDVRGGVEVHATGSLASPEEARVVAREVQRIAGLGDGRTIAVATPFRWQAGLIADGLRRGLSREQRTGIDLTVSTPWHLRGTERDVVVFSPCVAREMPPHARAYLASVPEVVHDAIDVARESVHTVGDWRACRSARVGEIGRLALWTAECQGLISPPPTGRAGRDPSDPVSVLQRALRTRGHHVEEDVAIAQWTVDLLVEDRAGRVAVCVGSGWEHRDIPRDAWLDLLAHDRGVALHGIEVVRAEHWQVRDDLEGTVARVEATLSDRARR